MSIKLSYGNPEREMLVHLRSETYLDTLYNELKNYPPEDFETPQMENELNSIITMSNNLHIDNQLETRYKFYDSNFEKYIVDVLVKAGVNQEEVENTIKSIKEDTLPLLLKLKYTYQRIRPKTIAFYFNQPLYPYHSTTADTPSYPSGHTFQSKVYCEVLGNTYPKYYQSLMQLAEDIANSRLYLGVHFPSDNEFALYCADCVLNHPEFKTKYKL
jgi:DNA-binding transcriptional regulator YhcF (GntR family)